MDYREFTRAVEEQINQKIAGGAEAKLYKTIKNNGTERTGLLVETPGINISPTIYLEEYYDDYRNGKPMGKIVDDIESFYQSVRREDSWDYRQILTYDGVKDRVVFKLVNTAKNRKYLASVPHMDFLDLSVVFYVLLEITEEGTASMAVTSDHLKQWNVRTDELWADAAENVKRLLPAEFFTMDHALKEILKKGMGMQDKAGEAVTPENLLREDTCARDGMYVLTNSLRSYGAACIVYPHILDMVWDILRTDFYVLPSSVHEVIITPCSDAISCRELDEMIRNINDTQVDAEEVLSGHAYLYERSLGRLCIGTKRPAARGAL